MANDEVTMTGPPTTAPGVNEPDPTRSPDDPRPDSPGSEPLPDQPPGGPDPDPDPIRALATLRKMRRLAWLILLAAACEPKAETPTKAPPAPIETSASTAGKSSPDTSTLTVAPGGQLSAVTPMLDDACAKIAADQREIIRRAHTSDEELRGASVPIPKTMGACIRDRNGPSSWVIALVSMTNGTCADGGCATVRWRMLHVGADGKIAASPDETIDVAGPTFALDIAGVFDWDNDGDPEILVRKRIGHIACDKPMTAVEESGSLWSFHNGAVTRSPLEPDDTRDVNHDGRLDLVTRAGYRGIADRPCIAGANADSSVALVGPELILRSQPDGSFSISAEDAKHACPAKPSPLVSPPKRDRLDLPLTARNVVCARLWGASPMEITQELEAHRRQLCDQDRGRCAELDILGAWAQKAPPILLAP